MRSPRLTDRRRLILRIILLCLLLSGAILLLEARGELDRAELWTLDRRSWRAAPGQSGQVVVIGIDDVSLQNMEGRHMSWPWPRSAYAKLIKRLTDTGARVIALDLLLQGQDRHSPEDQEDAWLSAAIAPLRPYLAGDRFHPAARCFGRRAVGTG